MKTIRTAVALALASTMALPVLASNDQNLTVQQINEKYLQMRAKCLAGETQQDRTTCLREAGAARAEAMRGTLRTTGSTAYDTNALNRCSVHKDDDDRILCEMRVQGEGQISGSVAGGGLLRESSITVPAK